MSRDTPGRLHGYFVTHLTRLSYVVDSRQFNCGSNQIRDTMTQVGTCVGGQVDG